MAYQYGESVLDRLFLSYQADKEPFIRETDIKFRKRVDGFDEVRKLKELFFPNYWNCGSITTPENKKGLEVKINELAQSFFYGMCAYLSDDEKTWEIVDKVIAQLPDIREVLKKDVEAAYKGDPAALSYSEIIRSYPGFLAILVQRVAHVIYQLEVPTYSRELTEHIHSVTGIDIHPGASIAEYFFIDHGTGVVIGETSVISKNVRIYQGVTLGALHFEKYENGMLKKGYKRHPTIGDHVVIGMGAVILGPVTIGNHASIGANSWIEEDIPDNTTVFVSEHPKLIRKSKGE